MDGSECTIAYLLRDSSHARRLGDPEDSAVLCRIDPAHHSCFGRCVFRAEERTDPAARDNAREVTLIHMAQLRSTFPLISGSERARPRVSHH